MGIHELFIIFNYVHDSVRKENLYNILVEFGIPTNLVRLIILGLNLTCSGFRVSKRLSDLFPTKNGLKKKEMFYRHYFATLI
jgi:hypothetical protein